MKIIVSKRMRSWTVVVAGCILAVYGLIYIDVVLRARSAYLEGEKYWSWHIDPAKKREFLTMAWEKEKKALDQRFKNNRVSREEYDREMAAGQYGYERQMADSAVKNAYIWYQTVIELFSPPESVWVRKARLKMPQAKELWRQELIARKVPFEEYMLE